MPAPSRDLIVNLVGKTDQLSSAFGNMSSGLTRVGSTLTRALTPAAAAFGVAMGAAFRSFDRGADALRVGTGATGDALSTLTDQMKGISTDSTVAALGMGRVGEILADVSSRTGATGDSLETLTTRFAQLERLGLGANVETVSRAFGDWSVATEDQAAVMDQLFRAAQSSGGSIDSLAGSVVQFGAPLRNLGFDMASSTALIASFEQNGVNLDTVMGGLKQGIGRLARAGEDVPSTFRRVVAEIENTENASEATRLAIELFGQRAGPDLADAIRNGQFAVEDMMAAIVDGSDTIDAAAKDTVDLSDRMAALRNRVIGAVGPFGELGAVFGTTLAAVGPMLLGLGQIGPLLTNVKTAFVALKDAMAANPFIFLTIALLAIGTLIFFHREKVLKVLTAAWDLVRQKAAAIWGAIKEFFAQWWPALLIIFTGGLGALVVLVVKKWDDIKAAVLAAVDAVVGFVAGIGARVTGAVSGAFDGLKTAASAAKDFVSDRIDDVVGLATGLPGRLVGLFAGMWDGIPAAFRAAINSVIRGWNSLQFTIPGFDPPGPGPKFGGFTIGTPDIPFLGKGAVVTSPTLAVIGDAGPEAVIPLSRHGSAPTVQINVTAGMGADGADIGRRVVDAIRRYERSAGSGWRR